MSTQNTAIEALTAELAKSNALLATKASGVTQTDEAALKTKTDDSRELYGKAGSAEEMHAIVKSLNARLEQRDAEVKELLSSLSAPTRKSEYDLKDVRSVFSEVSATLDLKTKDLFGRVANFRAKNSKAYQARFGFEDKGSKGGYTPTPMELVIRGALIADPQNMYRQTKFTIGDTDDVVRDAQNLNDAVIFWWHSMKAAGSIPTDIRTCPLWSDYQSAMRDLAGAITGKALDETDTSSFVPTGFSAQLITRYELQRKLVPFLKTFPIPRSPFQLPAVTTRGRMQQIAENTVDPESATVVPTSDLTDAAVTFTLKRLGIRTSFSYDLDEDSIVPVMTVVRDELGKLWAYDEEDALVNGDTTAAHMDTDVTGNDVRKAFDGFRGIAYRNSYTTDISAFIDTSFSGMIGSMRNYATNPDNNVFIIDSTSRAKLLVLKTTDGYPIMTGVPGVGPTPLVQGLGDVPRVLGTPTCLVEAMRTDLDPSGRYNASSGSKTCVLLVNTDAFYYAYNSLPPRIESWNWIRTLQTEIVLSVRRDLQPKYAAASNRIVWMGRNITA